MKAIFITPEKSTFGFEPIMWLRSQEMIETLRAMGIDVLPLETSAFSELLRRNAHESTELKKRVIIAPNFNYFLLAAGDKSSILNSLEKPILALWDDPLGALANFVNRQPGRLTKLLNKLVDVNPPESVKKLTRALAFRLDNPKGKFRRIMRHPLFKHFSWDSGHIETVESLGLVEAQRVRWYPLATYSPFLKTGKRQKEITKLRDVGFCGNVYLGAVRNSEFFKNEVFKELTTKICNDKLQLMNRSLWSLMIAEIENLSPTIRSDYGLYYDRKPFWDYYLFIAWQAANTLVRLGVLSKIEREVHLFGLFADPGSVEAIREYPNLKYEGMAHHFKELPEVYASTRINICISNGLVYKGIPSKLIDCLASGGFALCDPKEDLVRFFGPIVERIFFSNVEELNSKIDYYLAHPVERDEIVKELGTRIHRDCTLEALFRQAIACLE